MKVLDLVRKVFTRAGGDPEPLPGKEDEDDFSWFFPPDTTSDAAAWDKYWHDQLTNDALGFTHLFCEDGELVDAMRTNGLRTVLCVGNGVSQEARALAWAGFEVTALDLSPLAIDIARATTPPPEFLAGLVSGRSEAPGGQLRFVVGDLCDPSVCPGPFDVVIDRRTLQLFSDAELPNAMEAVVNRLATPGIFFSHCHDGGWRPPADPRHITREWFEAQGWSEWYGGGQLTKRVTWLLTTTG